MTTDARVYELPQPQYQLVRAVEAQLGAQASNLVACILGGSIRGFYGLIPADQESIVRALAHDKGVTLPC